MVPSINIANFNIFRVIKLLIRMYRKQLKIWTQTFPPCLIEKECTNLKFRKMDKSVFSGNKVYIYIKIITMAELALNFILVML